MYTISHFGRTANGTGTIRQTLTDNGIDVGDQSPYVNGQAASLDDTPPAGAQVTFRPKASGKAA